VPSRWLLPGAGVDAAHAIAYFGGINVTADLLVISGYATAGLAVTYLVMFLIGRPLMTAPAVPPPGTPGLIYPVGPGGENWRDRGT